MHTSPWRVVAAVALAVVWIAGCGSATSTNEAESTPGKSEVHVTTDWFRPTGADKLAVVEVAGPNLVGLGFMWNDAPVHFSADGGHTWQPAAIPTATKSPPSMPLVIDGETFLVGPTGVTPFGTPPTIWRSTDHGRTYVVTDGVAEPGSLGKVNGIVGLDDRLVAFGFVHSQPDPESLARWESTDKGATWTRVPVEPIGARNALLQPPVVTPQGSLLTSSNDGLLRSTDAGRTWVATSIRTRDGEPPATPVVVDGQVFTNGSNGVSTSADGGATWTRLGAVPVVPADTDDPEWSSIRITSAADGTISGVLTSFINNDEQFDHLVWADPHTSTWHLAETPLVCDRPTGGAGASSAISASVEMAGLFFATAQCDGKVDPGPHLLESSDHGRTWQTRDVSLPASLKNTWVTFSAPVALADDTFVFTAARNVEQATDAIVKVRVTNG
ncbi:MAG TPA: hypothetical protein VFN21_00810 [Acidimicrobiales bacterium]|nr:hypothetical protein [Acidimicrobiales bacterium]